MKIKFTEAHGETKEIKIMQDITISMCYCQLTHGRTAFYSEVTTFVFLLYPFSIKMPPLSNIKAGKAILKFN